MRARLVEYNFERGRDPKGKLGVGYGPARPQYIEDLEKALRDFGIQFDKQELTPFPDVTAWELTGPGDLGPKLSNKVIFLYSKPDKKGQVGWFFNPMTTKDNPKQFYDTPYPIIKYIVTRYYGDIEGHIQSLQDAIDEYKGIREKMLKWAKKWS